MMIRHPSIDQIRAALAGNAWLAAAIARVHDDPAAAGVLLPAAGRHCGRETLLPQPAPSPWADPWRADDAARVLLLTALTLRGDTLADELRALYRYGDADEKRGVLRALPYVEVGARCLDLLHDALRTNDTRLVAAALGPYAAHLDAPAWRQAVLKCVFMGVALSVVDALDERADAELAIMLEGLRAERHAAGRAMPDDAAALLLRLTAHRSD